MQTFLHIREDAHTLYGFIDNEEKKVFLDLISVSGIGAGTAMIILSSLSTAEIQEAIVREDVRTIQSIKGIGNKTAQRLILDLADKIKIKNMELANTIVSSPGSDTQRKLLAKNEAILALTALGIPKNTAEKNLETIIKKHGNNLSVEELIKLALKV